MIAILLLLLWLSWFPVVPASQPLQGMDVFNTGSFECSAEKVGHTQTWTNTGPDMRIYNAKLWLGADQAIVADVGAAVYVQENDSILFHENWDRYADPTGFHVDSLYLSPNYLKLRHNQSLVLYYWCQQFNQPAKNGNIIVTIWYR